MNAEPDSLEKFRTGKAYSVREAARLARTTPATIRRWLMGYSAPGHQMAPVFGEKARFLSGGRLEVSFLELVEIVVVARFRRGTSFHRPVKLERLRAAHRFAREWFGLTYPFASLRLKEMGGHVLHEFDLRAPQGEALALDSGGQWVLPGLVRDALEQCDFERELAIRWYPGGRDMPIAIDPRVSGGRPTVRNTGVTVDVIGRRFVAGESVQELADDFALSPDEVEAAIRYAAA